MRYLVVNHSARAQGEGNTQDDGFGDSETARQVISNKVVGKNDVNQSTDGCAEQQPGRKLQADRPEILSED